MFLFFITIWSAYFLSIANLQGCEREVAEAEKGSSDKLKSECIMRLSWALVHSKRPEDVQRGIAMLEGDIYGNTPEGYAFGLHISIIASHVQLSFVHLGPPVRVRVLTCCNLSIAASLAGSSSPLQVREQLYLLGVGYYRTGDYARSRQLVERCLEVWIPFSNQLWNISLSSLYNFSWENVHYFPGLMCNFVLLHTVACSHLLSTLLVWCGAFLHFKL